MNLQIDIYQLKTDHEYVYGFLMLIFEQRNPSYSVRYAKYKRQFANIGNLNVE